MSKLKIIGFVAAGIVFFVLVGGLGYVIIRPTNKTVVGQGGRNYDITIAATPKVPLGGCSIWRVNANLFWERDVASERIRKVKQEAK